MTDEEIRAGWVATYDDDMRRRVMSFARAIIAAERERCAKICEGSPVQIGCSMIEAEGVVRRTRNALAAEIRMQDK